MTADVAICDPCRDGTCDDCTGWAWCDLIDFPAGCDCKDSGHQLRTRCPRPDRASPHNGRCRMSDDTLRRAAALMRERAEAAKSCPPCGEPEGHGWYGLSELTVRMDSHEDAAHIASWHPAVALAVADWLGNVARETYCASPGESRSALTIAHTYLGESA